MDSRVSPFGPNSQCLLYYKHDAFYLTSVTTQTFSLNLFTLLPSSNCSPPFQLQRNSSPFLERNNCTPPPPPPTPTPNLFLNQCRTTSLKTIIVSPQLIQSPFPHTFFFLSFFCIKVTSIQYYFIIYKSNSSFLNLFRPPTPSPTSPFYTNTFLHTPSIKLALI